MGSEPDGRSLLKRWLPNPIVGLARPLPSPDLQPSSQPPFLIKPGEPESRK
jgi:hypothetical protein